MTAAVLPFDATSSSEFVDLSPCALVVDTSAEARKRRREILSSQRALAAPHPDSPRSASPTTTIFYDVLPDMERELKKPRAVEADETLSMTTAASAPVSESMCASAEPTTTSNSKSGGKKKPQMKYDPDVPMTKEEAAVWRREQRRKRNRESAAASRQRQRDRIVQLEGELDEWKVKYDEVMRKIQELEEQQPADSTTTMEESERFTPQAVLSVARDDGTCTPPPHEPFTGDVVSNYHHTISPDQSKSILSPTAGEFLADLSTIGESCINSGYVGEYQAELLLPSKMISRPAVKISGTAVETGELPSVPALPPLSPPYPGVAVPSPSFSPGPCLSEELHSDVMVDGVMQNELSLTIDEIIDNALLLPNVTEEDIAQIAPDLDLSAAPEIADVEDILNEPELGEFLLDAVDWL